MKQLGSNAEIPMSVEMSDGEVVDLDTKAASTIVLETGTVTADFTLSGFAGGEPGRIITVWNNTGFTCRLLEYDFSPNNSTPGNLIVVSSPYNATDTFVLVNGASVTLQYLDGPPGTYLFWRIRTGVQLNGGIGVTSVGLTAPTFLAVGGSPVTSTGDLALTLATQNANTVFAGPPSGIPAAPTFRELEADDFGVGVQVVKSGLQLDVDDASTGGSAVYPIFTVPAGLRWITTGVDIVFHPDVSGSGIYDFIWQLGIGTDYDAIIGDTNAGVTNQIAGRYESLTMAPPLADFPTVGPGELVNWTVTDSCTSPMTVDVHIRGHFVAD